MVNKNHEEFYSVLLDTNEKYLFKRRNHLKDEMGWSELISGSHEMIATYLNVTTIKREERGKCYDLH